MKKLKLTKKGKELVGVLAAVAALLLIILIFLIISLSADKSKTYDIVKLQSLIIGEYEDLSLREMDKIDLLTKFGIIQEEIPDSLALMSYSENAEGKNIAPETYVLIINTDNYQYFYDMLASQIDSVIRYSENQDEIKLYQNSILKAEENYIYMIISSEAKSIEQLINE